jgi:two-component system chemotaxis response regulator CheB
MKRVRVLIVEDSRAQRELLRVVLCEDPAIEVVGEAHNGLEAVDAATRLLPDVITMDLQMPRLGGLEAIDRIMAQAPSRIVVVCAVDNDPEIDLSFRAVAAGALEIVAKPRGERAQDVHRWGRALRESIHLMAEIPVVRRRRSFASASPVTRSDGRIDAFGIVASTGGPPAVAAILAALPRSLRVPVLIAQHIAPGFVHGLVRWLAGVTPLEVVIARSGASLEPGKVYLAPDQHDLLVEPGGVVGVRHVDSVQCPSGDALLESLARVIGSRACGVVLTGMGEDGARGVGKLLAAVGLALAQEPASCTVSGMPSAALNAGASCIAVADIAPTICRLCTPTGRA